MISWRVTATGPTPVGREIQAPASVPDATAVAAERTRPVYFHDVNGFIETPVYKHDALIRGFAVDGPALIEQPGSTIVVGPGDRAVLAEDSVVRVAGAWRRELDLEYIES
jgi:N-methylhydantoinase A